MIASLEYGVAVLGTRAIVVLGHGNCGAVKATLARTGDPERPIEAPGSAGRRNPLRVVAPPYG